MTISLIAAMARNRVIGKDNRLPWRLPTDLKWFKQKTMGKTLIMGRKTFESNVGPLPGRSVIVVTRQPDYAATGARVAPTIEAALALVTEEEVFIAGGAEIFRETLPRADRLYLTVIDGDYEGDTRFPELPLTEWRLVAREDHPPEGTVPYPFHFFTYERRTATEMETEAR